MPKEPTTIRSLRRAAARRDAAEADYRAAVLAAVDEAGYAEVAHVLGLSRQAVRQLVLRQQRG